MAYRITDANVRKKGFSKSSRESVPIGGGDCGANVWLEEDSWLHLLLSKTDSFGESGRLMKTGYITVQVPGIFSKENLPELELDLTDGCVRIQDAAGQVRVTVSAFVDTPLLAVRVDAVRKVPVSVEQVNYRDRERVLNPKDESCYGYSSAPFIVKESADRIFCPVDRLQWCHSNQWSYYAYSVLNQNLAEHIGEDPIRHRTFGCVVGGEGFVRVQARLEAEPNTRHILYILQDCRMSATPEIWALETQRLADELFSTSYSDALRKNRDWWGRFFGEYYLFAGGTPEAELASRGYTLQKYMNGCAGRGKMPIKFNGSIFTVHPSPYDGGDYDYRRWGEPYWIQNTRLIYWDMLYSGDFEGMRPFFQLCKQLMPICRDRARNTFGCGGILLPETFTFYGTYADSNFGYTHIGEEKPECVNRYIGWHVNGQLEIAFMMLMFCQFTGDHDFLMDTALPFAGEVLQFFRERFSRGEDGKLCIAPVSSLETWQDCIDDTPDLAGIIAVSRLMRELGGTPALTEEDLCSIPYMEKNGKQVIAPCRAFIDTEPKNCETPELYVLFPYQALSPYDSPEMREILTDTFSQRTNVHIAGWSQALEQAAILGMTDFCREAVTSNFAAIAEDCFFPAYWGPNFDWTPDQDHGTSTSIGLLLMALQVDRGEVRFLPAWPKEWNVSFRLPVPGGTAVLEYENGIVLTQNVVREK